VPGPPIGRFHSSESLQHPDFYKYRESYHRKMNHREIAVLAPVMSDNLGDIAQSHVANLIRRARANP